MKRRDTYDLRCFHWNKNTNTLHGDAWILGLGVKDPFIVKNYSSRGFREFKFYKEKPGHWIFKSEDDILCKICLDPNWEYDDNWMG